MTRIAGAAIVTAVLLVATASAQDHDDEGHVRGVYGTAVGSYPELHEATPRARTQARALWRRTLGAARGQFATYDAARALGYERLPRKLKRPVVFHLRRPAYDHDRRRLDARRPESITYWWPRRRSPVPVAFMYRMPRGAWPAYAKPLLGWHSHNPAAPLMTHVWLTGTLRTAIANCMPVEALEAANPAFRFSEPRQGYSRESHPCDEPGDHD
jgi:hypothetical protein